MNIERRKMLSGCTLLPVAVISGGATGALATCSSSGIQIDPTVLDSISKAVATACNFIPAVTTVIAVVNALFPAINGTTSVAEGIISQVAGVLCASAPATTAGKFGAKVLKDQAGNEIPVHGWVIVDGKLTYV
jgi:hypothetical protein